MGNGKNIRFWEDQWLGHTTLATQYWELYSIANDHNVSVSEVWDGTNLKITFRRFFDQEFMNLWFELLEIAKSIMYTDVGDSLVWNMNSKGVYTVKSFYKFINFRGVLPVNSPAVWKIKIPRRIQIFL